MIVGLTWPTPWHDGRPDRVPAEPLRIIQRASGIRHLRFNVDLRDEETARHNVERCTAEGFTVLPIFDGPVEDPDRHYAAYWDFAATLTREYEFPAVELLNEPHTLMGLDAWKYVLLVNGSTRVGLRTMARVLIAGEILKPDKRGPRPPRSRPSYVEDLWTLGLNPHAFDAFSIHHYRNPGPPTVTRFDDRLAEHDYVQRVARGRPLTCTEIGWDLRDGVTEITQAAYVVKELDLNRDLGLPETYLYAHQGPFGLFRDDWSPRPVAHAVREWIASHLRSLTDQED